MALVLINGISGSGKSAVCEELQRRGHLARDIDDGFAQWRVIATGEFIGSDLDEYSDAFEWVIDVDKVVALMAEADASGTTAYLCGGVSNEGEIWALTSHVIHLAIDDDTLRHRLLTRTTNSFGRDPAAFAACLEWNKTLAERNRQFGAHIIDATQPLSDVVDQMLAITGTA